jgi:LCP family protein required for cell wall assembly
VFTVLVLTAATALYFHLNANLHSDDLYAGATGDAGKEKADPAGRVPLNILVIGSDTRNSELDCKIGGGCGGGGANADVQMVVHVAADRSNATVMSIPRDTVTQLPACVTSKGTRMSAHLGQINSTLTYGPGCTVAAVHELTGIPIDHFVMVDFSGVIAMSDAVGGATICVSDNVYDTYSQLKLSKGKHTLKGMAALQFVRSRHGFGDGSDLGRTYAQHLFLSAVIRSVKSAGTLAHPATLYALADAATKAVTVDKALASIPALLSLASEINAVPTNRITFTTMQNVPDPDNPARVVPTAAARKLFATIIHDQSLTAATASQTPTPTPSGAPTTAAVDIAGRSAIAVKVENGTGQQGRAAALAKFLVAQGFSQKSTSTSVASAATTQLRYGPGQATQAQAVASALKLPGSALQQGTTAGVVLVVGQDWLTGNTFPKLPSVAPTAALNDAHAQTADQSGGCAQVSKYATSPLNGANVTPARAYALSPNVPDSDSGH